MNDHHEFDRLMAIAQNFSQQKQVVKVQPFGSGNINDTFLVSLQSVKQEIEESIEFQSFILQRLNTKVFREPKLVMQNMRIYGDHVRDRIANEPLDRQWLVPQILTNQQGQDYWQTEEGEFWRSLSLIANSQSFDAIASTAQAREVGYALGTFHTLTSDLVPERLADTLEGFHITPRYLQQYQEVLAKSMEKGNLPRSPEVNYCLKFVSDREGLAHILEGAKAAGKLPLRTMHGDPKVNNILFDRRTNLAVSMIDLDTVKSGLIHYDLGDCLRSGCNPAGEEIEAWESVEFDTELCEAILQGYLSTARSFLTKYDYDYIYDAIRVIAFELGLRFLTDYLAGNIYFHIKYPEHNLRRSLVQFRLLESIEAKKSVINQIIENLSRA